MTADRTIWQIGSGERTRAYGDLFLKYGVGLIGPGYAGMWAPGMDDEEFEGGFVRRFASEVTVGDVFLLRVGISTVSAVGLVASDYLYLPQFDDVNGWDLQHGRRVRWCPLPEVYDFGSPVFGAQPPRLARTSKPEVVEYAEKFLSSPPTSWQTARLPDLPLHDSTLEDVPPFLQDFLGVVHDLQPLFWDREAFGEHPTEDELICHFVIPFLRMLGWPPELISVKWRDIDVALFERLPRSPENCCFIIEAKRLGAGVEGALSQAESYLENLGIMRDVVVTDGVRYRMYSHDGSDLQPVAYANLSWLKKEALELIDRMKRK